MAGRLYALSTAGSLVGTLLSALLFIPLIGTRRTFLVFALAIAIMAVLGLRPVKRYALAPAAIAVLIALPVGALKAEANSGKVIYETDTEYQYARVIESPRGKRYLELNEGQAQHSIYDPDTVLTDDVWDGHLVLPFAARVAAAEARGDPRQRGGHHLARVREVLPRHAGRRRGDRPRAVGDRQALLRHEQSAAAPLPRGRAALPAPDRRSLRRHLGRRLPPALHPLLPGHARVLRADARPPDARWRAGGQRRPPRGPGRAREGAHRDDGRGVPLRGARPDRAHQHADRRLAQAAVGASASARRLGTGRPAPHRPQRLVPAGAARCAAAASTPTTRRRSSG